MAIFTKTTLNAAANLRRGAKAFSVVLNEARAQNRYQAAVTIFLSHCHSDRGEIEKAISILRGLGVIVYVDWVDSTLPSVTGATTAATLKDRIADCNKFILLATNGAIASKWCNWEVGYGDSKKYPHHMALLPVADSYASDWKGTEYLNLYPAIEDDEEYGLILKYPDGQSKRLVEWLRS
jgi:hypothetical protein